MYWTYYLLLLFLSYALQRPWLMAGAVIFFVLRPFLPDPWVLWRTAGRVRWLEGQVAANPANVTARRELARIYLERLRPRAALTLLDEARVRDPNDPELLFFTGVARLRSGDAEGALDPLVRAVDLEPRLLFGEPYRIAAEALIKLGRLEEAEDALERLVRTNSSSVEGHTRLGMVRHARGDKDGGRASVAEAIKTFWVIPGNHRRKQIGWWLRAHVAKLSM